MSFEFWDQPMALNKYTWLILTASALALTFFIAVTMFRVLASPVGRQAPNSRIAMELADSFKPSDRFSGFVDDNSSTSIVIIELPADAYEQVRTLGDNPTALAAQGVTGVIKSELKGREGEHVYLTGAQQTPLVDYAKFILIFREKGVAAMITANVPEAALTSRAISKEDVEAALASAEVAVPGPQPTSAMRRTTPAPTRVSTETASSRKPPRTSASSSRNPPSSAQSCPPGAFWWSC